MDTLSQRLKELPREDFEKLCFHLLKERHPNANVRHVDGASGDLGVDAFAGDLADGPVIWQSKAFANGIGKSQKEQIRQSLRQADKELHPKLWTLCISIDMDIHAHKWFQRLASSYASKIKIGLMQGSDITSDLMHRKSIRDSFFPGAAIQVDELRSLLTRTGDYTDEQMAVLTQENAQQYIERLKKRDARFNYEIVIATDQIPAAPTSHAQPIFSMAKESIVVNAYARDLSALQADPPKLKVRFTGLGVSKIEELVNTGQEQSFSSDEVASLTTDLPFSELNGPLESFKITPSSRKIPISTRVIFGTKSKSIIYDFLQFVVNRAGKEEVELVSIGKHPFVFHVVIRKDGITFDISERWTGARFLAAKKYLDAMAVLNETGEIEIYDLESDRRLFRGKIGDLDIPPLDYGLLALINDGARIAQAFLPDLVLPSSLTRDDAETLTFLKDLLDGEIKGINEVTTAIVKTGAEKRWISDVASGKPVKLDLQHSGLVRSFAGTEISTGPFKLILDEICFSDPDDTMKRHRQLPVGQEMEVKWKPLSASRVILSKGSDAYTS